MSDEKECVPCVPDNPGNTNIRIVHASIRWAFTYHNCPDIDTFEKECVACARFYVFGEETGKGGETNHLQGYIEFKSRVRPFNLFSDNTIHWEKAKGSKQQNVDYCSKESGQIHCSVRLPEPLKLVCTLHAWQSQLLEVLLEAPDDRTIRWYWDRDGNTGKTALAKLLVVRHGAIVVGGKAGDIKYGVCAYMDGHNGCGPRIVIIDVPRVSLDYISYQGIEEVKNGLFFSPKYESRMAVFNSPHVVVFANRLPDAEKLSTDRWSIIKIDEIE